MNIEDLVLKDAVDYRATDIHIDPTLEGYQVRFRVDGKLRLWRELDRKDGIVLVNQIKAAVGMETGTVFHPRGERVKSLVGNQKLDLRVTLAPCISGPKIAIRVLDADRITRRIPNLGLQSFAQAELEAWSRILNGMMLVTGPTSSGKTTTLYSLLHELARESLHVVTIEDPVEYEIDGINQIQVDPRHHLDFAEGVKTALRLDPDCVMIGEVREPATAIEATNAAIQGHVVMASMHSRDATSTVTRLRNFGIENHQICASLGVVINQRLVRTLCPYCREEGLDLNEAREFFVGHQTPPPALTFRSRGCEKCDHTGYFGRTGVFEIWNLDLTDYHMILSGEDEESIRDRLRKTSHQFILHDAAKKIEDGTTSFDEIRMLGLDMPWTMK